MTFLAHIVAHTPRWVFVLLAALLALGIQQCFRRQATLVRVVTLPLVMTMLAVSGVQAAFGAHALALPLWGVVTVVVAALVGRGAAPAGASYDAATRRFTLPGSVVPLLLILAVFSVKYTVGVMLGMDPSRAADPTFALGASVLYGVISGLFVGRALRLVRLSRRATPPAVAAG
jgi:hypothetical protein